MKKIYIFKTGLLVFILLFLTSEISYANNYYVSTTGNNSDGSSWANGYTNLQGALAVASTGDIVYIQAGTYIPHASDNSLSFAMIQDIEIYGGFSGTESFGDANFMENREFETYKVILSGDLNSDDLGFTNNTENSLHILTSAVTGVIVDGVTISGGNGGIDFGGAAKITGGDITFNNVIFKNNTAKYGGAISFTSATFVISNSVFYDNNCTNSGGAIYNSGCNGDFTNVSFLENYNSLNSYLANSQVYYGGASPTVNFINTIMWNNTATSGMYIWDGTQTITFSYSLIKNTSSSSWNTNFGIDGGNNIEKHPWIANQTNFEVFENSPVIGAGNATYGSNIGYFQGAGVALNEVFVKADASGNDDGTDWTNAYPGLKTALDNTSFGSIIYVATGTYTPDASVRTVSFDIPEGVFLYGGLAGSEYPIDQTVLDNRDFETNETILSGDLSGNDDGFTNNTENSYHVVKVNTIDVDFEIDGFTITGGNGNSLSSDYGKGGGIHINQSNVDLNNIHFIYNSSYYGGGIYSYNSTCDFSNMFFNHNEGDYNGSTFYLNYGNVNIYNVTASENGTDGNNESFYNRFCTTNIINAIFWGNHDSYSSEESYVTISNSVIQGSGGSSSWNTAWGTDGGNNKDEFPYFADFKNGDIRIIANSVANGTGNGTYGSNMGYYQETALAVPSPLYVKSDAAGTGDGSDWTNAYTNLMDAIDQTIATQKIYVAQGTYYPHASDRSVSYYLKEYVEIYGGFVGNEGSIDQTVIDNRDLETNKTILSGDIDKNGTLGGNSYNVFDIRNVDNTAVLDGFEISDGYASGLFANYEDRGAGIFLYYATPVLRNLQIIENYAGFGGGGMYLYTASPDLINISIFNNDATDYGSGIQYFSNSSPAIDNMIIYYNDASVGQINVGTGCVPTYTNSIIIGSGGSSNWDAAFGTDGGNNLDTVPYSKDPYNGDYKLLTASPAIGAGNATYGNNIGYYQAVGESMPSSIYVKADAGGSNNGTSWGNAFTNLNTAIATLVPFQDIYVAKGTYTPDVTDVTIAFELKEWSKIYGSFNGDELVNQTVIDNRDFESNISILSGDLNGDDEGFNNNADNSYHVVSAIDLSEYTRLDGFGISGGNATSDATYRQGGGVYSNNSKTIFSNLKISNNQANGRGGGFHIDAGAPKLSNISITNNYSQAWGGGLANVSTTENPILTNVAIWGNECRSDYPEYFEMQLLSTNISFENCLVPESGSSTDWQVSFGTDLGNNLDTIPYFVSYTDNDIRLLDKSTLLSAGKSGIGNNIGFYQGVGVSTPVIVITETLTDFGEVGVGLNSSEQSYTVSGSDLMDDLLIIAPDEFELSLTSGDFTGKTDTLTITPSTGTITTTNIYARFSPISGGIKSDLINHKSYGLPTLDTVRVSGTGAAPAMTVDNATIAFGSVEMYQYSVEDSYVVSAEFLTDDMVITAPTGFEISLTSGDYSGITNEITLVPVGGTIASTTIYVRFAPENDQYYSGNISHVTTGLSSINKNINGTGYHGDIYFVKSDASGNNDGANWDNAFNSLKSALSEVTSGDTIVVAKGVYKPYISSRADVFEMVAGVKIFGGFEGLEEITQTAIDNRELETNESILSGDRYGNDDGLNNNTENSFTLVLFDAEDAAFSNTTELDGFTISGGNSNYSLSTPLEYVRGGGIYMQVGYLKDCSPTLRNLIIENNTARSGGGIYMDGIVDSYTTNATTLENVQFINNYAFYSSSAGGGAIFMSGLPNSSCEPSLNDVAFINNSSGQNGGGIYMSGGYIGGAGIVSPVITNATFYGNTCVTDWGTALHINAQEGTADPIFNNVIFYGNDEVQIRSYATTGTDNPTYNHCLITGSPSTSWNTEIGTDGGENIEGDPLFINPENGIVDVLEGSPVLNTGDITYGSNIGYYQGAGLLAPDVIIIEDLTDFGTLEVGNSSLEQSFTVSGTDLADDIIITAPTGFEMSLTSGSGYLSELTLSPSSGTVITTAIYIRFTPSITGNHSSSISVNSSGITTQNIAVEAYAGGSPVISIIEDASICSSNELNAAFTADDDDLSTISFELSSTNETVVPVVNMNVSGSAGSYVLNITPASAGLATITVQITDANTNTVSTSFDLTVANGPTLSVEFTPVSCAYDNDASFTLSSTGGTGTVSYQLNNYGYTLQTIYDGFSEGDYYFVVLDDGGCTDTSDVYTVTNPTEISGSAELTQNISCYNDNDAIITAIASGGWGGFEYSIDGQTFHTSGVFENLSANYYEVYVKDDGDCYESLGYVQVYNPDQIIIDYINTTDPDNGNNGEISVVAYGGTYPLTYALNSGTYQNDSYFTGLAGGQYTVYVMDNNACNISEEVNLNTTGINVVLNLDLKLYPNPTSEYLYFDASQIKNEIDKIEIYDLNGQMQLVLNKDEIKTGKIDVSHLNQGAYLLVFRLENEKVIFEKIIKNN
ncbi:MAG: T9SS type A sorting domain-containing protein [Bacteroidales bacterium]|nr:T9SS type A sorting domain-containing protein [Bacteroidales bacterium]